MSEVLGGRHVSLWTLQVVGLVCLVIAVWGTYDGWRALGVLGVALLTVAELVARNQAGHLRRGGRNGG